MKPAAILLAITLMLGGCAAQGCTVWTRAELEALVIEAMRRGVEAARKQRSSI